MRDKLVFFVIFFVILLVVSSCGTTSIIGCEGQLGAKRDECISEVRAVQNQIIRYREVRDGL